MSIKFNTFQLYNWVRRFKLATALLPPGCFYFYWIMTKHYTGHHRLQSICNQEIGTRIPSKGAGAKIRSYLIDVTYEMATYAQFASPAINSSSSAAGCTTVNFISKPAIPNPPGRYERVICTSPVFLSTLCVEPR